LFHDIGDVRAIEDKNSIDYEPQSIIELDSFHLLLTQEDQLKNLFLEYLGFATHLVKIKTGSKKNLEFLLSSIDMMHCSSFGR